MGRAEIRKQRKYMSKKLTEGQYNSLLNDVNKEFINEEVKEQVTWFKNLFSECLVEAFEKNNIGKKKALMILDDVTTIMQRKASEENNGKA